MILNIHEVSWWYVLVYKSADYECMSFNLIVERLIQVGYPEAIRDFEYDPTFPVRYVQYTMLIISMLPELNFYLCNNSARCICKKSGLWATHKIACCDCFAEACGSTPFTATCWKLMPSAISWPVFMDSSFSKRMSYEASAVFSIHHCFEVGIKTWSSVCISLKCCSFSGMKFVICTPTSSFS